MATSLLSAELFNWCRCGAWRSVPHMSMVEAGGVKAVDSFDA